LDINLTVTPADGASGMLIKRSFSIAGHRTSIALEPEFWAALETSAARRGEALAALILTVDAERAPARPLASALRVYALREAARVTS
jgi:predicted DNA-binding ribbon-helix-helix protein